MTPKRIAWNGGRLLTLTIAGETRTPNEWAAVSGTPYRTIISRRHKGYSDSAAVFGDRYAKVKGELRIERPRAPVAFQVTVASQWGSVRSVNFRRVA